MKKLLIATGLAVAAASLLAACGGNDDEGEHTIAAVGNTTDRAFVAAMVPHHEAAIEMAEMAQDRGRSEFVTSLADDIVGAQKQEIETMRKIDQDVEDAGVETGDLGLSESMMGMSGQMSELEHAGGGSFDATFMQMMIPHHQGAIRMARIELAQGENPELKQLAQQIIEAQSREIDEMNSHLGSKTGAKSTSDEDSSMGDMHGSGASDDGSMGEMGH